ncbi:MAG: metallophosphoesterase [Planctomycetes bacterium]|nr:metallophosphoesterase [Planctomycetota bacterium]
MKLLKYFVMMLIIFSVSAYGSSNPDAFIAGPYLLDVTTDSATVAFRLNKSLSAKVIVSDADGKKQFTSEGASKSHFIKITGLQPGMAYDYQVICGENQIRTPENDYTYQIRTACRSGESFSFAVYGDPRPGDTQTTRHHKDVIDQAVLHEPAFCLVLGDMVDDGEKLELWQEFFQVESELLRSSAIYPVMGDNDYADGKGIVAEFFPKLKDGFYKFEWGGIQFFALNAWDTRGTQSKQQIDAQSPQLKWLESELAKEQVQKAPFRIVFIHDPVYISRGRSSEILQRVWVPIFEKYKVDVVFASWHMYERSNSNGITYIISGGAGAELLWMKKDLNFPSQAEAQRYHFCRIDINSNMMTIRAIADDGTVLDSITLTPRAQDTDSAERIERLSKRLSKQISINNQADNPVIPLYLFSYDCSYCRRLLKIELPALAKQNEVAFDISYFDLGIEGTYDLLLSVGAEFGRQGTDIPTVFIGRSVLGGEGEIGELLPKQITAFLKNPLQYQQQTITPFKQLHDTKTIKEQTFNSLTYALVASAGLIDGVNPCAFTTIIFLISYLSLVGAKRKQMICTGGIFTIAVFITYFAIGLVFFNFARVILREQTFAKVVNVILLSIVVALCGFSLVDFLRCLKGNVTDVTLQLPKFLKERIREKIRNFAKNNLAMVSASFVLGVVIAGMELTCTGQVYIPIVTMISEPQHRVAAIFYLFVYNVAFILPLVVVFILAILGVNSEHMAKFFRKHIATVKLAFVLLFAAMALMIIYNLRWI